jgi:glycerophosphoryl diester phosphodiesterase
MSALAGADMEVFGHRGSPGFPRFAENTPTSFRKALESGAAGFELDVRRCADGTLVVVHDATIDRTTNGRGRVSDLSYNQLSGFDAGFGDPIPRLADILDAFGTRCTIHVELKEAGLAQMVATIVMQRDLASHVVLSAFDSDDNDETANSNWNDLASVSSFISTALLATAKKLQRVGYRSFVESAHRLGASGIHPPRNAVTTDLIAVARGAGLAVRVWTVNDSLEAVHLSEMGADAIFSDFPERCIRALCP